MYNNFLQKRLLKILVAENNKVADKISFNSKSRIYNDPVTKFDRNIERKIRKEIKKKFPNDNLIGEEFGSELKSKRNNTWIIDPIDGTKALLCGQPTWSNLIGIMSENKMILSFANFPVLQKYYITKNEKSYSHTYSGNSKQIRCSKVKDLKKAKLITNSIHTIENEKVYNFFKNYKNFFKITGIDSYNFCSLCDGNIDIIIEAGLKQVDILPIKKLIENAGGIITNWSGSSDISKGSIVASANLTLHNKILKLLKKNKIH